MFSGLNKFIKLILPKILFYRVLIIVAALLFFLGMPLRKIIKSNIDTNLRKNKNYKPNKLLLWMYESSGLIILFIISIIFTLMFI